MLAGPFRACLEDPHHAVSAIVFLASRDNSDRPFDEVLRQTFAHTPMETRVALLLVEGHSIDEMSAQLAIARNTARAHLRSLFDKTGTSRHDALIALLSREISALQALGASFATRQH